MATAATCVLQVLHESLLLREREGQTPGCKLENWCGQLGNGGRGHSPAGGWRGGGAGGGRGEQRCRRQEGALHTSVSSALQANCARRRFLKLSLVRLPVLVGAASTKPPPVVSNKSLALHSPQSSVLCSGPSKQRFKGSVSTTRNLLTPAVPVLSACHQVLTCLGALWWLLEAMISGS